MPSMPWSPSVRGGSPESGRVLLGVGSRVASRSAVDAGRVSGAAPGARRVVLGSFRNVSERCEMPQHTAKDRFENQIDPGYR